MLWSAAPRGLIFLGLSYNQGIPGLSRSGKRRDAMGNEIIDMHIPFGAPSDPASGCYWSHTFKQGIAYHAFRLVAGLPFGTLDSQRVKQRLLKIIDGATVVTRS